MPDSEAPARLELAVMGTLARLSAWGPAAHEALDQAAAELEALDRLWSSFRADSEVGVLNAAGGEPVRVSAATARLIGAAVHFAALTHGAFDITLGGAAGRQPVVEGEVVRLPPGARIDLGGIGKGAASQRVGELMRSCGVLAGMVDLGQSSIAVVGLPPGRDHWRIALRRPPGLPERGGLGLRLRAGALSTSGDYEQSSASGNHIIDPRTRRAADSGLRSATVLCQDGARAEALSTALMVLGAEEGMALHAELGGFEAVMVDAGGRVHSTAGLGV